MITPTGVSATQKNNIRILGNGTQPLLFAHGYGCDQNMWRHMYPAFEEDYKIILFDHVGAGNSDEAAYSKEKYGSLDGYAQDILEICEQLELQEVVLVAHSVSAMMAVLAANKQAHRFAHLIMVCPSPSYLNDGDYGGGFVEKDIAELMEVLDSNYLGWAADMAPKIMGNPHRPELGEELVNSFCRTNPEIAKQFARVTFLSDNRKDLPLLEVPCLILQCSEDVLVPKEVGEFMRSVIKYHSYHELQATGHCPNLSAPEETIATVKNYLNTVSK